MTKSALLRIGTRGSPLALAQAQEVRARLAAAHGELAGEGAVEIVVIKTSGDRIQDRALAEIGGKGLFTKEIEDALLEGAIDLAVHSMKDVPTWLPEGLEITTVLPREDPRDALFAREARSLAELPRGAVVGTSSLRRQAQVLMARPDLEVVSLRGNVGTRLRKLEEGQVDATMLAVAGLKRLGEAARITAALAPEEMLPAVAQGAIGLEARSEDAGTCDWLEALDDRVSACRVEAERACLEVLDGSCRTPIAALAEFDAPDGEIRLRALIALPDGSEAHSAERRGPAEAAAALGRDVGAELRAAAGPEFFAALAGD
ncbi:MAG: hydroxymethylbilane synthase [Rhodospirillales bacterium]|nr:hydroxymethylbilane synthase [Rhodospirillales bacterium]